MDRLCTGMTCWHACKDRISTRHFSILVQGCHGTPWYAVAPWNATCVCVCVTVLQTHLSNVLDKERAQTVSDTDALLALLLELSLLGALQKVRDTHHV